MTGRQDTDAKNVCSMHMASAHCVHLPALVSRQVVLDDNAIVWLVNWFLANETHDELTLPHE